MADFALQDALDEYVTSPPNMGGEVEASGSQVDPYIAGYRSPGHYPWTCANCLHYSGDDQAGSCAVVTGPWSGQVHADDDCRLFMPGPAMLGADMDDRDDRDENDEPGPPDLPEDTGERFEAEEAP